MEYNPTFPLEINPVLGSVSYDGAFGLRQTYNYRNSRSASACKLRQDSWKLRLTFEAQRWTKLAMLTLTYDKKSPECPEVQGYMKLKGTGAKHASSKLVDVSAGKVCPSGWHDDSFHIIRPILSLNRTQIKNYVKRVREQYFRDYSERMEVTYFIAGEYGDSTKRPHYHVMLLFNDERVLDAFTAGWIAGSVDNTQEQRTGFQEKWIDCSFAGSVANYIAKYVAKCDDFDHPLMKPWTHVDHETGEVFQYEFNIERPFANMSKHIGENWLDTRDAKQIKKNVMSIIKPSTILKIRKHPDMSTFTDLQLDCLASNLRAQKIYFYDSNKEPIGYKLPRYYFERLFKRKLKKKEHVKIPKIFDALSWNSELYGDFPKWKLTYRRICQDGQTAVYPRLVATYPFVRTDISDAYSLILAEDYRRRHSERLEGFVTALTEGLRKKTGGFWPLCAELSETEFIYRAALAYDRVADTEFSNSRETHQKKIADDFLQLSFY